MQGLDLACEEWRRKILAPKDKVSPLAARWSMSSAGEVTASLAALAVRPNLALGSADGEPGGQLSDQALRRPRHLGGCGGPSVNETDRSAVPAPRSTNAGGGTAIACPSSPSDNDSAAASPVQEHARISQGFNLLGPHGASAEVVRRSMTVHPNSPSPSQDIGIDAVRPRRPVAVMYSPGSELPRKVKHDSQLGSYGLNAGFLSSNSARCASSAVGGRSRFKVKRLGWDVAHHGGVPSLLAHLMAALETISVRYEMQSDGMGVLTSPTHTSDGMGPGTMQAVVLLSPLVASPISGSASSQWGPRYRIDVSRYSGDTFQFHAFYRKLRDQLYPVFASTANDDDGSRAYAMATACGIGSAASGSQDTCSLPDTASATPTAGQESQTFWGTRRETRPKKGTDPLLEQK